MTDDADAPLPPLLATEHQELIRAVERATVQIAANRELMETRINTLITNLDERFDTQTRSMDVAFASAEKAVDKANTASEKRFEAVNEFRGQLSDVLAGMITRTEADARFKSLEDKITDLKSIQDKGFASQVATQDTTRLTRGDLRSNVSVYVAVAGVVLTILIVVIAMMNYATRDIASSGPTSSYSANIL